MRTAPKAGHMTAADQIVTASKKSLDPRAPSTHEHLARVARAETLQSRLRPNVGCLGLNPGRARGGAMQQE